MVVPAGPIRLTSDWSDWVSSSEDSSWDMISEKLLLVMSELSEEGRGARRENVEVQEQGNQPGKCVYSQPTLLEIQATPYYISPSVV